MFGLSYKYGLPEIQFGKKTPLVMVRAKVLPLFTKAYPNNVVYQIEDTLERIEQRLHKRLEHGEDLGSRLTDFHVEINEGRKLAHRVFTNANVDETTKIIKQAIVKDFSGA